MQILVSAYRSNYDWICAPYNEKTKADPLEMRVGMVNDATIKSILHLMTSSLQEVVLQMANVLYWYFFSKVIELMDTVLMILRKKNDQV